jgi:beta-phosphoglucomutase
VIRAVIFDLDGTLVETEALKAASYARAAVALRPHDLTEAQVIGAYEDLVGRTREEVAAALAERFHLPISTEVFLASRIRAYGAMLADPELIRAQEYPYATGLLRMLRAEGVPLGLATMSQRDETMRVLAILGLTDHLDVIVTREEVRCSKPDPEIYLLAAARLGAEPSHCLALEDSVPGVSSALAAGCTCVGVSSALTRAALRRSALLPADRMVEDPRELAPTVSALLATHRPERSAS